MISISELKVTILKLVKNKDAKNLFISFLALVVLQALNVILPLLTIPYLIKTVGLINFGLLSFVFSFAIFFQIVVEYGFNTISTRDISIHHENHSKLTEIYNGVLSSKFILLLICSVVYVTLVFLIPKLRVNYILYLFQFGCIIGQAIFPIWFFQGIQKMKYITYLNVIFKSIFTICIFIFVKSELDVWMVPMFNAFGFIFSGVASLLIVHFKFGVVFKFSGINKIREQLKNGLYLFLSELQVALIVNANTLILGFFAGNAAVGIYSAAEKIIRAIGNLQAPVMNALFPYISKNMQINGKATINKLIKIKRIIIPLMAVFTLILFVFTGDLFKLIFEEPLIESILVFRILILFPLFSFLDQFYGRLILLTHNLENKFFKIFYYTSILSLILNVSLTYYFSYKGTAIANLVVQFFVFLGMYLYAKPIIKKYE